MSEYKAISFEFQTKQTETGEMRIKGYGSIFGNTDRGGDVMVAGCFRESLQKRTPKMGWQHDIRQIPGVWEVAQEDSRGLYLEGRFIDTTLGRDAYVQAKEGAVEGLSIGYSVKDYGMEEGKRMLKSVELYEVSPVTFPMNEQAKIVAVKSDIKTIRDFETALRDVFGFTQSMAKAVAANGFKQFDNHRDDGLAELSKTLTQFNNLLGVKTND